MLLQLWPFLLYVASVLVIVAGMLGLSYVLGPRHHERATGEPYEGGIKSYGTARLRYSAQFYVVALLFLVFDLEAAFIYAWAIAFREVGWAGYAGAVLFIAALGIVLIYAWRMGALDWSKRKTAPIESRAAMDEFSAALRPAANSTHTGGHP